MVEVLLMLDWLTWDSALLSGLQLWTYRFPRGANLFKVAFSPKSRLLFRVAFFNYKSFFTVFKRWKDSLLIIAKSFGGNSSQTVNHNLNWISNIIQQNSPLYNILSLVSYLCNKIKLTYKWDMDDVLWQSKNARIIPQTSS